MSKEKYWSDGYTFVWPAGRTVAIIEGDDEDAFNGTFQQWVVIQGKLFAIVEDEDNGLASIYERKHVFFDSEDSMEWIKESWKDPQDGT